MMTNKNDDAERREKELGAAGIQYAMSEPPKEDLWEHMFGR